MPKLTFTCPHCGSHKLEEVMQNVCVISEITVIPELGGMMEYGEQTNDDGNVVAYQCGECGNEIAIDEDELHDSETLTEL